MHVHLMENGKDIDNLRLLWNQVLTDSNVAYPFLTYEWVSSWWTSFYSHRRQPLILLAKNGDRAIPYGIAPLMLTHGKLFKIIEFMGTGISDYLDFILREKSEETIASFIKYLNDNKQLWDLISLRDILSNSGNIKWLVKAAHNLGLNIRIERATSSPYLPISENWDQFLESKSSNFRYSLKRNEKRAAVLQSKLRIIPYSGVINEKILDDIVRVEKNSWKIKKGAFKIQDNQQKDFFRNIIKKFSNAGWLHIWMAYLDEKPVAYQMNFDFNDKIWFYNGAYIHSVEKQNIGSLLTQYAIKNAFFAKKKEYDFLRGDEHYKSRWTSKKRVSYHLIIYKQTLRSIFCYTYLSKIYKNIKRLSRLIKL